MKKWIAHRNKIIACLEDYNLFVEAERRMAGIDSDNLVSHEDLMKSLGITEADLDEMDVEIE